MTEKEVLKLALEALENAEYGDYDKKELNKAIIALREELAREAPTAWVTAGPHTVPLVTQPEQEPVAYSYTSRITGAQGFSHHPMPRFIDSESWDIKPLYTAPPQPEQNLNCKSTQARLATAWGYVKAQPKEPEQEPVAWRGYNWGHSPDDWVYRDFDDPILDGNGNNVGTPLYTTPQPRRKWFGLTPADFDWLEQVFANKVSNDFVFADIVCVISAKLKEKNSL